MTISQAQLALFKEIYKQHYGRNLDDAEAFEIASNLLGLYFTVYVDTTEENDDIKPCKMH